MKLITNWWQINATNFLKFILPLLLVAPVHAGDQLPLTPVKVPTPHGYQSLCLVDPRACVVDGDNRIIITEDIMVILNQVNTRINRRIKPREDNLDIWSINPAFGDCEDYALTKRSFLVEAGLPSAALRIALAFSVNGEVHAVLIAQTTTGDLVLDSMTNRIKMWHDTPLTWIAVETTHSDTWYLIANDLLVD